MNNEVHDLLNIVPCGIICFTGDSIITKINQTLLSKLQYEPEELAGQHIETIFTISSRIFYQTHFFPLLKLQGKAEEIFLTLLSKNKETIPVLINALQTIENGVTANICACIPVYERKKYEDEILQAKRTAEEALYKNEQLQKIKEELEAGSQELDKQLTQSKYKNKELLQLNDLITHDLQEPLRKISLHVDLIQSRKGSEYDEKNDASFNVILKSTNRIRSVLKNLQEYVSLSTQTATKSAVHVNDLVSLIMEKVVYDYPGIKVTLSTGELPLINANAPQLQTLLEQLLNNCYHFRSLERNLWINLTTSLIKENLYCSTEGKYKYVDFVKIVVEDNGIGFNPQHKEHIFKLLKKLNKESPGLGFGLAICKRIAENHGGTIMATGEEHKGAKFTVTLPVE